MNTRHTHGFSCAPGSGFFARCPKCSKLLIFGQTCVCGMHSAFPNMTRTQPVVPLWEAWSRRENAPRSTCRACSFEYETGTEHACRLSELLSGERRK